MTTLPLSPPASISVVIPTMNRAEVLLDTLGDLNVQDFADFEVIVVDQSDTPNEAAKAIMAAFPVPARYLHVTHFRGLPEARNFGFRCATNNIVLYIDDDIRCEPNFLQAHLTAHLESGAALVAGNDIACCADVACCSIAARRCTRQAVVRRL